MNYWWVNHKQTFKQEFNGGYIWSPKRNRNGAKNHSYDNMTKVQPGDVIFSFADAAIQAIGTISTTCLEGAKPTEFGTTGENWEAQGWLVRVDWKKLTAPLRPKDHIEAIRPLLSDKYAPIQKNGNGNQSCYLANISKELAETLFSLTGHQPQPAEKWEKEDIVQHEIEDDQTLTTTEKQQLVTARRGQGKYRQNLEKIETHCRITGTTDKRFLIASHIKPWRDSNNAEKLDGHNGFLLAPHIDKLFDGFWISFSDDGDILCANSEVRKLAKRWHINLDANIGSFTPQQKRYLEYHRSRFFEMASS